MATSKVYRAIETVLTFKDSGGDAVITLANLGFGAGRVSAQYDRGTGSKPMLYMWRAAIQYASAPQLNELAEIYLFESDGTYMDGTLGASDAALTSAKKVNGKLLGYNTVDTTSTNTDIVSSGLCFIVERYISIGVWNGSSGDNFRNSSNTSVITLTPVPPESQ